jgi:hypothetical protein
MQHSFELLTFVGFIMLGTGLFFLYRALVSKSKLLSDNVVEISNACRSAMTMIKKSAHEIDLRFEEEKKLRVAFYLSISQNAETHETTSKGWQESELLTLQNKIINMIGNSMIVEENLERTVSENRRLKLENMKLQNEYDEIKSRHDKLVAQNRIGSPSIKM